LLNATLAGMLGPKCCGFSSASGSDNVDDGDDNDDDDGMDGAEYVLFQANLLV